MTTKEFNSYLDGYLNGISVLDKDMSLKLLTHINPRPDKMRDMDDNSYIHYMRGILTALTQNKDLNPTLLSHCNHLLQIVNSVETQITITIDHKNKYDKQYWDKFWDKFWDKYKNDPLSYYWFNEYTIPLNRIKKPNFIDIRYYDMNGNSK